MTLCLITVNLNFLLLPWHLSPPHERVILKLSESLKGTSEMRTTDSKWMGVTILNAEILKNRDTKAFHFPPVAFCLHERLSKAMTVNAQWCIVTLTPCDVRWLSPKRPRLSWFCFGLISPFCYSEIVQSKVKTCLRWGSHIKWSWANLKHIRIGN